MATIPTPTTQAAAAVVTSTLLNNKRDGLEYLLGINMTNGGGRRALCRARLTSAQNLATSGTAAALVLDSEDVDYDNGHSTVTNPTRYTGATAGYYAVSANCSFAANITGQRIIFLAKNGTEITASRVEYPPAGSAVPTKIASHCDFVQLNGTTDYIEVWAIQTSGGALNVDAACMTVRWISE